MGSVARAAVLVAFPVAAAIVGGALAVLRPPGARTTAAVQHFAAGVVFAATAVEVLPDLHEQGSLGFVAAGFALGVAVLLLLRQVEARTEEGSRAWLPVGLAAAVGLDLLIDGLLIGVGVHIGPRQALILTVALTLEILFLGLSVAVELTERGARRLPALATVSVLAACTAVGAVAGAALLSGASHQVMAFVLAFGVAALLYLVTEELLTEAHEESGRELPWLTAMFFAGFLAVYLLDGLAA